MKQKAKRIRKFLRNKYKVSDCNLDLFMMTKWHLDHIPTRQELINLELSYFFNYAN